jgi:tRNA pseudouridine55 synthase
MRDGVVLIDKGEGMTSFDVVGKIRRLYGTKQVGHTGTLDPMATGLLTVLVGRAVKASEYLTEHDKTYRATLRLGLTTDTEDVTGKVLTECDDIPDAETVKKVCQGFVGEIKQIPPMYSALKKDGKKLCDLAREGIEIEREARDITVYSLTCKETDRNDEYTLEVACSKGTYIRTLCADIGKALGCGGVMATLRRTSVGEFSLGNAVTLTELESMTEKEREALVLDTETLFYEHKKVLLPDFFARLCNSGCEIYLKKLALDLDLGEKVRLYDKNGFFSLGEVREFENGKAIKPIKKFRID